MFFEPLFRGEKMKIYYTVKEDDLVTFLLFLNKTSKTMKKQQRARMVIIFIVSILYLFVLTGIPESFDHFIKEFIKALPYWLVFFLIWYALRRIRYKTSVKSRVKKLLQDESNQGILGKDSMEITDKGLKVTNEHRNATVNWESILKIENQPGHYFIFDSDISALIIPKRSFEDEDSLTLFIDEVTKKINLSNK